MTGKPESIVRELLARHGRLYSEDAGVRLADRPGPLYQLLNLTMERARQVLIYNRDRSVNYQGDASPKLIAMMNGDAKAFFRAKLRGTVVDLRERVDDREW